MKNAVNQPHWLFQGAVILTIAGLLSKVLSAVYRVPFQNIVGDTGFYIYQQVYPFLGIAIMLGTTGFPVMVSKLLSEHGAENRRIITKVSLVYITLLSLGLISLFIYRSRHNCESHGRQSINASHPDEFVCVSISAAYRDAEGCFSE